MHVETAPELTPVRILVGGPVRKPPGLLTAHLESIDAQILPPRVVLSPCMVDDDIDPESSQILRAWCEKRKGIYLDARTPETPHFSDQHPQTHQWSPDAMIRVGELKNSIIRECVQGGFDALWLVDADLIFAPRVLWSLWYSDAPIACGVFWTRWQNTDACPPLPQVWLRHPYELDGRGQDAAEFVRSLTERQRVPVWGQGACTLYRRQVFEKGLTFDRVDDLPKEGMWLGEDRHLCTRAERMHLPMVADAWPDIRHCYHPTDQENPVPFPDEFAGSPQIGHQVSLHLQAIEPIPVANNQVMRGPVIHERGRLGRLHLAEEIEAAVMAMQRGESQIVKVVYPSWSKSQFKGQTRLIQVTLVDWRPAAAPVGV